MDSTPSEPSDLDDLLALTRQFRGQLQRRIALGGWAAPGAGSPRLAFALAEQPELEEPGDEQSLPQMLAEVGTAAMTAANTPAPELDTRVQLGRRSLAQVRAELGECTRCKLAPTRTSIVFGVGAEDAPLMFVGEAPGEQEDLRGEPFVGRAGELLDKMIEAMGWQRSSVYIANTTKCRPPGNRNPQTDELAACIPFLDAQILAIAPRIIVALGRPAANQLLGTNAPISALRGKFHDRAGTKVMPTFHPAYLLREPDRKRDTWADLKLVMGELARLGIAPR
ncbi:MAG: uracil-DNA glycosylase family protein [Kofleriaceae bacterium]